MQITEIDVTTTGLYAWGKGFLTQKQAEGWDTFWRNHTGNLWHAYLDSDGSVFLSTIYGGGMIHPMDFKLVLRQDDVKSRSELAELDRILHHLAQTLGFTYWLKVRGHAIADGMSDWRLFSTEKGVATAVPGRTGVPEAPAEEDEEVEARKSLPSVGPAPYKAEIVTIRGAKLLTVVGTRYQSEESAVRAIVKRALTLKHTCGGYTRHWVTEHNEHIIDYGSHTFYGRITSNRKDK